MPTYPVSDSVQALITARLDGLEPEAKSALLDAAVIGSVFWAGALAAMAERPLLEVLPVLQELTRRELITPARDSAFDGEDEYSFAHMLVRDVAYSHLPRAGRAVRHVAAAKWIESKSQKARNNWPTSSLITTRRPWSYRALRRSPTWRRNSKNRPCASSLSPVSAHWD